MQVARSRKQPPQSSILEVSFADLLHLLGNAPIILFGKFPITNMANRFFFSTLQQLGSLPRCSTLGHKQYKEIKQYEVYLLHKLHDAVDSSLSESLSVSRLTYA